MKPRELPGALALGLLASLAAHAASFGGRHQFGGAYHGLVTLGALAGAIALAIAAVALAWGGAGRTADGSIVAARISALIPGVVPLVCSAGAWFGLVELTEGAHGGAPALAVVLSLVLASWLVRKLARAGLRCVAAAAIAIRRAAFAPRLPVAARSAQPQTYFYETPERARRFARPPPVAFDRA